MDGNIARVCGFDAILTLRTTRVGTTQPYGRGSSFRNITINVVLLFDFVVPYPRGMYGKGPQVAS